MRHGRQHSSVHSPSTTSKFCLFCFRLAILCLPLLSGCQTTPTREQQIKRATKQVLAIPFSERGALIHQIAKQGDLPVDVANVWITEWNEKTLKIAKAEKEYAKQQARLARQEQSLQRSRSRLTPAQLKKLIGVYDRGLRNIQTSIDDLESLRPSYRREREPIRQSSLPRLQSLTITPAGGGSFYASDPSVPNSTRYYEKKGDTYYWSE